MAEERKSITPPYTSYKSFLNLLNDLRETGIPSHIDTSVAKGSNSGKATMVASLKAMGLTRGDNTPTDLLEKLVKEEDRFQEHLKTLIQSTYPFLFNDVTFDLGTTTTERLKEKFNAANATGSTATKCIAFFLSAAKAAGVYVSPRVKAPVPLASTSRSRSSRRPQHDTSGGADYQDPPLPPQLSAMNAPEGMEKITVPLRGMEDAVMFFPADLDEETARKAVKAAVFNLRSFYGLDDDDQPNRGGGMG